MKKIITIPIPSFSRRIAWCQKTKTIWLFLIFFLYIGASASIAQNTLISGVVTSEEDNQPMPGVSILLKGTNIGTVSDLNGKFSIYANNPNTDVLVFSFLGFLTQEVVLGNRTSLEIIIKPDISQLDEVVIVGYGETKRRDLTGSVGSMNSELIKETNKVNAFQALQGQVAGVMIQSTDNKPGGGFNVRIRGSNTINSNETTEQGGFTAGLNPLFIVDGIFVDDISFLNPSDIERMDVLKDASATAIYGSRGSNGVVIIETKKGSKGKVTVQYDNYIGVRQAYNIPDMLQGEEFLTYFRDAVVGNQWASGNLNFGPTDVNLSDFLRPNEIENVNAGRYVNWIDMMLQNGTQQNHTLNLTGGTESTIYGFGLGYTKDEGTFPGEDFERVTLRANVNGTLSKYIKVGFNNYASFDVRNEGSREGLRNAYRLRPTGTPYEENGEPKFFPLEGETFITSPLFEPTNMTMETKTLNYLSNLSLAVTPTKNITITSNFSPNIQFSRFGEYRGRFNKSTNGIIQNTRADVTNSNRLSYVWDNIFSYNGKIGNDHVINGTFVYSQFLERSENFRQQRRGFSTDQFLFYNMAAGPDVRDVTSGLTKQSLESYTARINYIFKDKYLLTLTGRYDGASILAAGNKWAFFPSAALAWRISDENFMKSQSLIDDLKLRVSYGQTGNNGGGAGLRPLGSQSLIGTSFTNLGDRVIQTAFVNNLANRNLEWERTKEINFGLDFGLFKSRIYGSVDVYQRNNEGIIFFRPTPNYTGFSGVFENVGEASNKGIELTLNSVNIDKGDLKWTTSLNFSSNRNQITKLYGDLEEILFGVQAGSYIHRVGQPVGSIFTWEFDGIWQLDQLDEARAFGQLPGQVRVKDLNGDGVINAADRNVIGNNMPKWMGGMGNNLNYKNFDLSIFLFASIGAMSNSYFHISHSGGFDATPARFNSLKTNYWTPENPSNEWFQPSNQGPFSEVLRYQDVSYVQVGYITLGYNFGSTLLNSIGVKSLRLYFTAQDPFIFTSFEGWDPESAGRNSWGSAHMSRILMGGLNVKF
ncbi:TonB-dependent receptor [Aquiflexum sp. LQ15W]|uniref:SusC/RagA family TonB-linked outer membrane protein n=1 Tax=Cognataquiflexum nitidum TaxID=2922272 RepID=UPI001F12B694|nr:TonB-dependent receptor [Cognataquiflexum nitidum]MCH6198918.1 TonB-dependent receptor [Cognataquiflexum nitidum]